MVVRESSRHSRYRYGHCLIWSGNGVLCLGGTPPFLPTPLPFWFDVLDPYATFLASRANNQPYSHRREEMSRGDIHIVEFTVLEGGTIESAGPATATYAWYAQGIGFALAYLPYTLEKIWYSTLRDLLRPIRLSSLGAIPNSLIDLKTRRRLAEGLMRFRGRIAISL